MATRSTGFAAAGFQIGSGSPGYGPDCPHAATLEAHAVPFMHFFDGFRTSHEVNKIEKLTDDDLRAMVDDRRSMRTAPAASPGPSGTTRHRSEPGCLLPGP